MMEQLQEQSQEQTYLWRAVIVQAFVDAVAPVRPARESDKALSYEQHQRLAKQMAANIVERGRARIWLTRNSRDFRDVCALALLDADAVRDAAMLLSRQGWPGKQAKKSQRNKVRRGEARRQGNDRALPL